VAAAEQEVVAAVAAVAEEEEEACRRKVAAACRRKVAAVAAVACRLRASAGACRRVVAVAAAVAAFQPSVGRPAALQQARGAGLVGAAQLVTSAAAEVAEHSHAPRSSLASPAAGWCAVTREGWRERYGPHGLEARLHHP
jgi:hypothetical protein